MADRYQRWNDWAGRYIADLCKDFGLKPFQAAAFPGNFAAESGYFNFLQELHPLVPKSAGGLGHAQWTGPRRRRFEAWLKRTGRKVDSYEGNYSYMWRELSGAEPGLDYRKIITRLKAAKTIEEAVYIVGKDYEGPAVLNLRPREKAAHEALELYDKAAVEPTVWHPVEKEHPTMPVTTAAVTAGIHSARRAVPWFKSIVTLGAGSGLGGSLIALLAAYNPAIGFAEQLSTLWPLIITALGSGSALVSRIGSDAQPLTMSQGKADEITAERTVVVDAPTAAPMAPEAWANPSPDAWKPIVVEPTLEDEIAQLVLTLIKLPSSVRAAVPAILEAANALKVATGETNGL